MNKEIFVIDVGFLGLSLEISIYPVWKAQILLLLTEKVIVPVEYLNFADVFLKKLVTKHSKYFAINEHLINLETDKYSLYGLIYSLKFIELKIFKTFIKTNLA